MDLNESMSERNWKEKWKEELMKKNVILINPRQPLLECSTCGKRWSPNLLTGGKYPRKYWVCPNKCNLKTLKHKMEEEMMNFNVKNLKEKWEKVLVKKNDSGECRILRAAIYARCLRGTQRQLSIDKQLKLIKERLKAGLIHSQGKCPNDVL